MSNWPKRDDGTNKTIGEMTAEERRAAFSASVERLRAEFSNPHVIAGISAVLESNGKPN